MICGTPLVWKAMEDEDNLERMIDGNSLKGVLRMMERIAYKKAKHIEENWQDHGLAREWDRTGHNIGKLAERINLD